MAVVAIVILSLVRYKCANLPPSSFHVVLAAPAAAATASFRKQLAPADEAIASGLDRRPILFLSKPKTKQKKNSTQNQTKQNTLTHSLSLSLTHTHSLSLSLSHTLSLSLSLGFLSANSSRKKLGRDFENEFVPLSSKESGVPCFAPRASLRSLPPLVEPALLVV
jgi:hypothetical protein